MPHKIRFPVNTDKIYTLSSECENNLIILDMDYTLFPKTKGTRRTTILPRGESQRYYISNK